VGQIGVGWAKRVDDEGIWSTCHMLDYHVTVNGHNNLVT
jgi:hypothetical protein